MCLLLYLHKVPIISCFKLGHVFWLWFIPHHFLQGLCNSVWCWISLAWLFICVSIHALAVNFHHGSLYLGNPHTMLNQNNYSLHGILFCRCSCSMMFHLHIFIAFAFSPLFVCFFSSILSVRALFLLRCHLGPSFPCTLSRGHPFPHPPFIVRPVWGFFSFLFFLWVVGVLFSLH